MELIPAKRPERVTLAGRLVSVEPLNPERHGEALWQGFSGGENDPLWLYLREGPFSLRSEFDRYLSEKARSTDAICYAIVGNASGVALGIASLMRIDPPNRVLEVGGIHYSRRLQRTAAATEAMYLLARYVFEDLKNRRYEWKCDALNTPSRRAAQRLGFTFEGIFRQHMIVKGRNRDTAWYSMLDSEWPDRKERFETWLRPENFDQGGVQKQRLGSKIRVNL
jgi:RimJ/RimL family protein N-acetyltransferase